MQLDALDRQLGLRFGAACCLLVKERTRLCAYSAYNIHARVRSDKLQGTSRAAAFNRRHRIACLLHEISLSSGQLTCRLSSFDPTLSSQSQMQRGLMVMLKSLSLGTK